MLAGCCSLPRMLTCWLCLILACPAEPMLARTLFNQRRCVDRNKMHTKYMSSNRLNRSTHTGHGQRYIKLISWLRMLKIGACWMLNGELSADKHFSCKLIPKYRRSGNIQAYFQSIGLSSARQCYNLSSRADLFRGIVRTVLICCSWCRRSL